MSANRESKPDSKLSSPKQKDALGDVYNPATAGDGPAAKLWELLRRNPAFREDVAWMLKQGEQQDEKEKIIRFISSSISSADSITRPIVGYVLRWLWEPLFTDPIKILQMLFGTEVAEIVKEDLCLPVFGLSMCRTVDGSRQLDPGEFMSKCPIYLLPAQNLYSDGNQALWMRLMLPSSMKEDYSGPLRPTDGTFNLNTPWPETPRMFRDHFSWLWANYDAKSVNPYTGDRTFLPRPAAVGSSETYGLQEQHDKLYPRLNNEFIFVVPACFHTERSINGVYEAFKASLEKEFRSLQVSAKKYEFLLGGRIQWDSFSFVYGRTEYSAPKFRDPFFLVSVKFDRFGSGNAILEFEREKRERGEWKTGSKFKGHLESWHAQMEDLMMSVYPGDDFQKVVNLLHPGWPNPQAAQPSVED